MEVWKFPLKAEDEIMLSLPHGAKPLHVATQGRQVCLWVLVDPTAPMQHRHFRLAGTGHPIHPRCQPEYIGTFMLNGGSLVFHLFETNGESSQYNAPALVDTALQ